MKILFEAKINGNYYYYDQEGFLSVYDNNTKEAQCIYRTKVSCNSKKDFEMEAIYASSRVEEI